MASRLPAASRKHYPDEEDLFAPTRMSFGDHLEDLRMHMWRALAGFATIMALVFGLDAAGWGLGLDWLGVGKPVMDQIGRPVEVHLQAFYDRQMDKRLRQLEELLRDSRKEVRIELDARGLARAVSPYLNPAPMSEGLAAGADPVGAPHYVTFPTRIAADSWYPLLADGWKQLGPRPSLKTFSVTEAMVVYLKVALACGFVLGSPWIFWQAWSFVAVGLYPHEKRLVHLYLPFSLGLFLAGVLVCQRVVMPRAVEAMLWFNDWLDFEPDLRLSEWLGFAIWMPVVFGLCFQLPLVMRFIERLGLLEIESFRRHRRLAWFGMALFAALVTPSVDLLSLFFLWLPLGLLYELGILFCHWRPRPDDDPEQELVEC
jgi:sec-independent protein translocase protein TatC